MTDRSTTHFKFDLTWVRTQDFQIIDSKFHVPGMLTLINEPSVIQEQCALHCTALFPLRYQTQNNLCTNGSHGALWLWLHTVIIKCTEKYPWVKASNWTSTWWSLCVVLYLHHLLPLKTVSFSNSDISCIKPDTNGKLLISFIHPGFSSTHLI